MNNIIDNTTVTVKTALTELTTHTRINVDLLSVLKVTAAMEGRTIVNVLDRLVYNGLVEEGVEVALTLKHIKNIRAKAL